MTSEARWSSYSSVKFLRASSTLETFKTVSENVESVKGTEARELCGLTGEEARRFYETLLKESNEKDNQGGPDIDHEHLKPRKPKSISLQTKRKHSSSSSLSPGKKHKIDSTQKPSDSRKLNLFLRMAQDGNLERLCEVIRDGEIDIDATDQFGWTALMCSSHSGHKACVKFLLKHGAKTDLRNNKGHTAEDIAERAGASRVCGLFQKHTTKKKPRCTRANPVEQSQCEICKSTFSGTRQAHDSSTVHLFNCQYKSERTRYHIPEDNIGFQLMKKKGWDQDKGLGPEGTGRKFPVKTILKQDRLGLGSKGKARARVTHFSPKDPAAVETKKTCNGNMRVPRNTSKRKLIQNQIRERKWEHDMRVYMNTD